MHYFLVHSETDVGAFCNLWFNTFAVLAMSLKNVAIVVPQTSGISLVRETCKRGPRMLPCGTPACISLNWEYSSSYLMRIKLFFRYALNKIQYILVSCVHSFVIKPSWLILSTACDDKCLLTNAWCQMLNDEWLTMNALLLISQHTIY